MILIPLVTISCSVISYLQSKKGPYFFIPKSCLLGYHRMQIPISQVPEEHLHEPCMLCRNALSEAPDVNVENPRELQTLASLSASINRQASVLRTSCGHYFHDRCLLHHLDTWDTPDTCPDGVADTCRESSDRTRSSVPTPVG